jgi:DNA invertase Pin-like site-specific DNA recombinase
MKTRTKKMNLGYIRNSRITQENSLETQRKMITDYCNENSIHLDKIIVDEGCSGSGNQISKRHGYNQIINLIEKGMVSSLVVIEISRWGRDTMEIYSSVKLMDKMGVKFFSIKEKIDDSIYGRFFLNLLGNLYDMELSVLKLRVKETLSVRKSNNKIYGNIPYGKDCLDGENLIDNPKENKLIRKMISLRKKNFSYGEITNFLNRNRYKSKSGKKFTRGNVYGILKSRLNYV